MHGFARRRGDLGSETREFVQHDVCAEDEIARVPEIPLLNERVRPRFVGPLDEALDAPHLRIDRERLGGMDIAVAGRRMIGHNPEGDDFASGSRYAGPRAELSEPLSIPEDMVGGEHGDDGLRIERRRPGSPRSDRGRAVTPFGLEQDRRLRADVFELLGNAKPTGASKIVRSPSRLTID
jgi:hypothetical protein